MILIIQFILIGCDTLTGHKGVSNSADESKSRSVYISEYHTLTNPVILNDTLVLNVDRIWLEKRWFYGKKKSTIISDGYQLILTLKKNIQKDYSFSWTIGVDGDAYFRNCSKNSLMTDFDRFPSDTLVWVVQTGDKLKDNFNPTIIKKFVLVRNR
ncbi:MAG: hypothetical protein ACOYO1_00795 [Bacteroidales bacterium]